MVLRWLELSTVKLCISRKMPGSLIYPFAAQKIRATPIRVVIVFGRHRVLFIV
jgi:hypothetical protein